MNEERITRAKAELLDVITNARREGRSIALTNGCFDILHVGHIRMLQGAKSTADILVVAINSDSSAHRIKGEGRPIITANERAEILLELQSVDWVHIFDEPTVDDLLETVCPDVYCKGTEYTLDEIPEAATVRRLGVRFESVGDHKSHATTSMIEQIRASDHAGAPAARGES